MDDAQTGWFIQLLAESWECARQCFLPADEATLQRMAKAVNPDPEKWAFVMKQFSKSHDKIYHKRLLAEFRALCGFRKRKSQAGKNGAVTRWHSHSSAIANDSSASAMSSAISNSVRTHTRALGKGFEKPTKLEMDLQAAKIGLPESEIQKFFDYYESNGWRVGRNPMRSWQAAMSNWKRNIRTYENNQRTSKPGADRNRGTANEGSDADYSKAVIRPK